MHGERTPLAVSDSPTLTHRGAEELHYQGAVFRNRYLRPSYRSGEHGDVAPIIGLDSESINSAHLKVVSSVDSDIFDGAVAFMRGLYPPSRAPCNGSRNVHGNRDEHCCHEEHPHCEHRYPIRIISQCLDRDSIWYVRDDAVWEWCN